MSDTMTPDAPTPPETLWTQAQHAAGEWMVTTALTALAAVVAYLWGRVGTGLRVHAEVVALRKDLEAAEERIVERLRRLEERLSWHEREQRARDTVDMQRMEDR